MSADVADALRRVRVRIEKPEHFCQGVSARDSAGIAVSGSSPQACCWCVYGALECETSTLPDSDLLWTRASRSLIAVGKHPICVNDDQGHAAVLDMLDRAVAAEEASA